MKNLLFIILTFSIVNQSFSQYTINYNFIVKNSESIGESLTISKTYLITNGKTSKFTKDRVINGVKEDSIYSSNEDLIVNKSNVIAGDSIGYLVIKNFEKDSLYIRMLINKKYNLIKQKMVVFDWKIINEHKQIMGFNCQKAILKYLDRDFECWFTNDIPINDGPWKFCGLPGLIVEIKTLDGKFEYNLIKIRKTRSIDYSDYVINSEKTITYDEYVKTAIKEIENLFKYKKSKFPESDIKISIDDFDLPKITFE